MLEEIGKGIRSATSSARFVSSTASCRRMRSGSEIEIGTPLPLPAGVAFGGRMETMQLQAVFAERVAEFAHRLRGRVIEMEGPAKNLDSGNSRVRDLRQQSGRERLIHCTGKSKECAAFRPSAEFLCERIYRRAETGLASIVCEAGRKSRGAGEQQNRAAAILGGFGEEFDLEG